MSYDIDAWLENGEPRLQIIDADSGAVRLAWGYRKQEIDESDMNLYLERLAVKDLFQKLFLLSSLRNIKPQKNPKPSIALNALPRKAS